MERFDCCVYKGRDQPDTYLYLPLPDDFSCVPQALLERLGTLELALNFELTPQRPLARAAAPKVIAAIKAQGFYLQLPPGERA